MKYTHGPIVEGFKYDLIINLLQDKFYKTEYEEDCKTITKIKSKRNYDLGVFEERELKVINDVIQKFKNKSCAEISNISHREDAWLTLQEKDYISYDFAEKLRVNFE